MDFGAKKFAEAREIESISIEVQAEFPSEGPDRASDDQCFFTVELAHHPIEIHRIEIQRDDPDHGRCTLPLDLPVDVDGHIEFDTQGWMASAPLSAEIETLVLAPQPSHRIEGQVEGLDGDGTLDLAGSQLSISWLDGLGADSPEEHGGTERSMLRSWCRMEATRDFECSVPRGTRDFRLNLGSKAVAPLYFWGLELTKKPFELEKIRFTPGGSLTGWVAGASLPDSSSLGVQLLEAAAGEPIGRAELAEVERRLLSASTGSVDTRGFFQVTGVPAGRYELRVSAEDFAEVKRYPIEIASGEETHLQEPMELEPMGSLSLTVEPAFSPLGEPWEIHLMTPGKRVSRNPTFGKTDFGGHWAREDIEPGPYRLMLFNRDAMGMTRWHMEEIEVEPGENLRWIEVPIVPIEGTLIVDDGGAPGTVWFGGRSGATSVRFEADGDGVFRGGLPRGGLWELEVRPEDRKSVQSLEPMEITQRADGQPVRLVLELPDTRVEGRVVSVDGQALPSMSVRGLSFQHHQMTVSTLSDREGRFSFEGLRTGPTWFLATGEEGTSESSLVEVTAGEFGASFDLVVHPRSSRDFQLTLQGHPVAGAEIWYQPTSTLPQASRRLLSGADGRFTLDLPENNPRVDLLILPNSGALKLARIPLDPNPDHVHQVQLQSDGGVLQLDIPENRSRNVRLFKDNVAFSSLSGVRRWAGRLTGGTSNPFVFPLVEPGNYVLCPAASIPVGRSLAPGEIPEECQGGWLQPGGLMHLELNDERKSL